MGAILFDDSTITLGKDLGINLGNKQVSQMKIVTIKEKEYVLIMINNNQVELFEILK